MHSTEEPKTISFQAHYADENTVGKRQVMEAIAAEGASLTQYKANCRKMANLNREKVVETFKKIEKLKKSGVHPARLQGLKRELEGWKAWQRRWETWFEDADSDWANLGRGK